MSDEYQTTKRCTEQHAELMGVLREIRAEQRDTHRRMFVDNGTTSLQSRLSRLELFFRALTAAVIIMALVWSAENVPALAEAIRGVL